MKPASRILLLLFAALALAAACGRNAFDAQVERAETMMDSAPDSALAIAEALNPGNRAEQARAALLLTKARYKANVPLTNDSIIASAASYYSGQNDSLETQALFLLAETYYEKDEAGRALLAALKAEKRAVDSQDWFNAGRIHRLIAQIFAENYSYSNEYKHRIQAADYFKKASKREYALWEELDAVMATAGYKEIDKAKGILKAIAQDTVGMPNIFKGRFHRYSAVVEILTKEYEAVIQQMHEAYKYNGCYTSHDYSTMARACSYLEYHDEAKSLIDSAKATVSSYTDLGNLYLTMSEIADKNNDKDEANKCLKSYLQLLEPKRDSIIASPIEKIAIDYYDNQIKQANEIRTKNNTIIILSITILVLALIFLSHRLYKRKISIHLQKERIQQLVLELEKNQRYAESNSARKR